MKKTLTLSLVAFLFLFLACKQQRNKPTQQEMATHQDNLIKANKYLVKKDADMIGGYVRRRNWQMITTQTGLWYMIYEKGTGAAVTKNKQVTLNYKLWLLDGTLCYNSEKLGPKTFRVTQGGVEPGLEEGVLLLHVGDKARFIMPPHLAHGLVGDQNKIPARASIVYEVEVLKTTE